MLERMLEHARKMLIYELCRGGQLGDIEHNVPQAHVSKDQSPDHVS